MHMKISIIGYFDMGSSIGIDDSPFIDEDKRRRFEELTGLSIKFPVTDFPPEGVNLPIGTGLKIDLMNSRILSLWQEGARSKADEMKGAINILSDAKEMEEAIKKIFHQFKITKCFMNVYSIGIIFLRLDIEGLPSEHNNSIINFYRWFERAVYDCIYEQLKVIAQNVLVCFGDTGDFKAISTRIKLDEIVGASELFKDGLFCIVICEEGDDKDKIIKISQKYEGQYSFQSLNLDDGILHLGWAVCVLEPRRDDYDYGRTIDPERIIDLLHITQVFFGICKTFENLFAKSISESVRKSIEGSNSRAGLMQKLRKIFGKKVQTNSRDKFDVTTLNKLRTIAGDVVELTNFSSISNNISDICLFNAFEKYANINAKHSRIRASSDIFLTVQNEIVRLENEIQEKRLTNALFVLTSLTFVSVLADIINTVDYVHQIIPDPRLRFIILVLPPLLIILIIWKFVISAKKH